MHVDETRQDRPARHVQPAGVAGLNLARRRDLHNLPVPHEDSLSGHEAGAVEEQVSIDQQRPVQIVFLSTGAGDGLLDGETTGDRHRHRRGRNETSSCRYVIFSGHCSPRNFAELGEQHIDIYRQGSGRLPWS